MIFAPAYGGTIDRAERFVEDFRALPEKVGLDGARFTDGFTRIAIGIFKKFVIADTLAMGAALTPANAAQTDTALGMWLLLYGYALRLYFDYQRLQRRCHRHRHPVRHPAAGKLRPPVPAPEHHRFLASWHMTLSNWARFYIFSPLSLAALAQAQAVAHADRAGDADGDDGHYRLVARRLAQFPDQGIWPGVGLFVHKKWTDRTRKWYRGLNDKPSQASMDCSAGF
ncbi:MAG: hypothetical protein U0521_18555 [Anaerolineae bacterium]